MTCTQSTLCLLDGVAVWVSQHGRVAAEKCSRVAAEKMHPTHGLISTQVFTSSWLLKQGQFAEQCALLLAGNSA